MTLLLLLFLLLLIFGVGGFAFHVLWWGLIVLAFVALFHYLSGRDFH